MHKTGEAKSACAGHSAPISQVCCDHGGQVALSASYDKTVRVWSYAGRERAVLTGHAAPVLELCSNNAGGALTGDRSGNIMLWDVEAGACTWAMKGVHKGHVTALAWADGSGGNEAWQGCFASGGQDGCAYIYVCREHGSLGRLLLAGLCDLWQL